MKYIGTCFRLAVALLTLAALADRSQAQSAYIANSASMSAYAAPTPAADDKSDPQNAMITIHAQVNEVNVLFIATDKRGKFVRDLNQKDFTILDDHKPPQAIVNFRRETDLPLHMGLLLDVSGSVDGRFEFEQEAATSFLQRTLRTGFDQAFVEGFNTRTQMAQDFTDNAQLLAASVRRLRDGGGTALYDAVYRACKEKFLKDRSERPVRKAIIIISDGEDNPRRRLSRWRSVRKSSFTPSRPTTAVW